MTDWKPIRTYVDDARGVPPDEESPPSLLWDGEHAIVGVRINDGGKRRWIARAGNDDATDFYGDLVYIKPTHWAPIDPPKRRAR